MTQNLSSASLNQSESRDSRPYIVGIGASAGGLEALRSFFTDMPQETGLVFVVIQHLAPDHKSLMVELLARATRLTVMRAVDGMEVRPNHIYLIPPKYNMSMEGDKLRLTPGPGGKTLNLPIDIFFRSLAEEHRERSVAVILSGTGSDGARGIRAVKEMGGMVMVQAEASAKFAGMPSSAIATGTADYILPVEDMPEQLINFCNHPFASLPENPEVHIPENSSQLEQVCARLKERTGIDFAFYKHATLVRRIERRMNIAQTREVSHYVKAVNQSALEADALAKDLLIGVTKFFRDGESFDALREHIETLFASLKPGDTLRLWSAACSTGEEAYTLAILCEEIRSAHFPRIDFKVFATDVDKAALDIASAGIYPRSVVADLPPEFLERYFTPEDKENFRVNRPLRDRLIFARQDVFADPPFTKIHVLTCRNLLIYIRPEAQKRLLGLFHFALQSNGILFLGSSETLGEMGYAFETLDSRHRIYLRSTTSALKMSDAIPSLEDSVHWNSLLDDKGTSVAPGRKATMGVDTIQSRILMKFAPATIAITPQFDLLYSMGPTADFFQIPTGPINLNVVKMVSRDLGLAISSAANQALREKKSVEYRSVQVVTRDGEKRLVKVVAEPFETTSELGMVILVSFLPETPQPGTEITGEDFDIDSQLLSRVGQLESELQSTRESLQSSIEQQETANEELQAANEELLAANEELQSTNEELESVNEELYTVNAEYQGKIQELTELNDDMENFARSTDIGTIFFDADLRIRRFTPVFGQLTGLNLADVGRNLGTFAHAALLSIREAAPRVLHHAELLVEDVLDLPGQGMYLMRLIPYRVEHHEVDGLVASLVDVTRMFDAEEELRAVLDRVQVAVMVTDEHGYLLKANDACCSLLQSQTEELLGTDYKELLDEDSADASESEIQRLIREGKDAKYTWYLRGDESASNPIRIHASVLTGRSGALRMIFFLRPSSDPKEK